MAKLKKYHEGGDKSQYWKHHLDQWGVSGLSQKEYCRDKGVALSTFWYWKKRLTDEHGEDTRSFIRLSLNENSAPDNSTIEIEIPGFIVVRVRERIIPEVLQSIIITLRGAM